MLNVAPLPTGFQVRSATMADLAAVVRVQNAQEMADFAEPLSNEARLRKTWQAPDSNLQTDTWVVENPDGQIVSYAHSHVRPGEDSELRVFAKVWLLPDYQRRGIGRHLLHLAEEQARGLVAQDVGVTLAVPWISERNQAAQHLLQRAGYQQVLSLTNMKLALDTPPPAPVWNNEIVVRPFQAGKDEQALYIIDEEISQEERGYMPREFDVWQQQNLSDPSLIFLAWEAEQIVGLVIGGASNNQGWIWHLGVRSAWRKQGLGMALLRLEQAEFYRRGLQKMSLNVDTLNPTGAMRLYERVGMHTHFQYHRYEKKL
ncbi:hypothetical protein KDW_56730 [Dictyobacter vulcani]|uniref:N-acetyltransferase domain-containing protein n=1 Tax=Dictyobacter vulcani TaxID=2607529 RepID=A0A5J4KYC9_9CHLR|nr:GNAT family N-acetyltransferase [Dictyobacter vulcani]GER91511.1 hypothetical protein KDW_56730 [Dictyobacter vulcani]